MTIDERWTVFKEELHSTAQRYGRDSSSISVMAVTKTQDIAQILAAQRAGLELFGENRVEEAGRKFASLPKESFPLHMVGHLQGNKVKEISTRYSGVHSVDSLKLALRLSRHRERLQVPLEILLQVNTSGEARKSGFSDLDFLVDAAAEIAAMPMLNLRGLMTMAPFVDDERTVRKCFSTCRLWSERVAKFIDASVILSMGMSGDHHWAVAEGATLLRIGTAIFGSRS